MFRTKLSGMFPAFSHRNYRLFWFGQCISLIGTWMQTIGQSWLVLKLTDSPFKLGLVSAVQFLPMMIFSLFAGTFVDRFPKRTVLLITQASLAILAVVLATLTYFNVVQYWHVLVLAALLGLVNTLDMPTRQSFFVELVGREDLMNAIALNSTIFNLARILGPAVAGFLIGAVGIGICFYLNALSFLAVIIGLWLMDIKPNVTHAPGQSIKGILKDIFEGLSYIKTRDIILQPLLLLAVTSMFVMNFNVLVPFYATHNLGQDAAGYGFLMTSMGMGSFLGALILAAKSKAGPCMKFLLYGAAGMSFLLAAMGLEHNYILACFTLLMLGFCAIAFTTLVNSTIQLNTDDHMRGRVMSVYSLVFGGVIPIGSIYAGKLTEVVGAPSSMFISGIIGMLAVGFVAVMLFKSRKRLRECNRIR
jgi:MFS family permease